MRLVYMLVVGVTISSAPLAAQAVAGRPALLFGGGVAGQYDGDRDLGSPGVSGSVGLQWAVSPAVGIRLEAQGSGYGRQALPAVVGARGSAERIGSLVALATWEPRPGGPVYLLGGGGLTRASVTGAREWTTGVAAVLGVGTRVAPHAGLEVQYLHAARPMGSTRAALAARVLLRF